MAIIYLSWYLINSRVVIAMNSTVADDPVELWANVIPATAIPMIFCSVAALLASVFLNRWVSLAVS